MNNFALNSIKLFINICVIHYEGREYWLRAVWDSNKNMNGINSKLHINKDLAIKLA